MRFWKKFRKFFLYVALICMIKLFIEVHHFDLWTYLVLSSVFIIPELLSEYKPELLSYIIARRETQIYLVVSLSMFCAAGFFFSYPFPGGYFTDALFAAKAIFATMLQGAILGLVGRMLLLHLIYQLVRLRDVFISKILILIVYSVFLVLLPLESKHLISSFFVGFCAGFIIHYISRYPERRNAVIGRLRQNLLTMIEDITHDLNCQLSVVEEKAVNYFAREKWYKLQRLLDSTKETAMLFFIKLCMLRKLHLNDAALHQLREKEASHIEWYNAHENYFLLHRALNNNEKTLQGDDKDINKKILDDLRRAIELDETCLLSHASLALKLANLIDLDATDPKTIAVYQEYSKEAEKHINRAMDIYENRDKERRLLSILTGMTVPCTYSFLLDSYGYIMLKSGKLKFAKSLLVQCIFQDPSFSPAYVHLAECYKEYYKNTHTQDVEWKKAARLLLHIAIYNEEYDSKNGAVNYITKKAKNILQTL
jgi:hypothetical protein